MSFTVEGWLELQDAIAHVDDEFSTDYPYDVETLIKLRKASDFIKETLGIKTEPIVVESVLSGEWYYTNIYTVNDAGLITSYSKRPATEEEIKTYKEMKKKEEYKGKKFDISKGGIHASNPPEDFGLGLCHKCKNIIETKDWENPKATCEECTE